MPSSSLPPSPLDTLALPPAQLLPPEMGGTGTWRPIDQAWKDILAGNVDSFRPPRRALTSSGTAAADAVWSFWEHAVANPAFLLLK